MTKNQSLALIVLLFAISSIGCGNQENESLEAPKMSQATPEDAFAVYKYAVVNDNWDDALTILTPESKELLIGVQAVTAATFVAFDEDQEATDELKAILEEHGIPDVFDAEPGSGDNPSESLRELGANVEDQVKCLSDLSAFMKKHASEKHPVPSGQIATLTIDSVDSHGDHAHVKTLVDGKPSEPDLIMIKTEDKWFIDLASGLDH